MLSIKDIEDKIRIGATKHNLKLYPGIYYDASMNQCCVIGAIILSTLDKLPSNGDIITSDRNIMIITGMNQNQYLELEAAFEGWRSFSNGDCPELFQLGMDLRSEIDIYEEEEEQDPDYDEWA